MNSNRNAIKRDHKQAKTSKISKLEWTRKKESEEIKDWNYEASSGGTRTISYKTKGISVPL